MGGSLGAVERNALRYHLGMVAHLDTLSYAQSEPGSEQFERRIARWFELTERYPRQLHEMSEEEYFDLKRREHEDQKAQVARRSSQPR